MKNEDVIREIESMLPDGWSGYQIARDIFRLAGKPPGAVKRLRKGGRKRDITQAQAVQLVTAARKRIELADEGETAAPGKPPKRPAHAPDDGRGWTCTRCGGTGIDPEMRDCRCDCCGGTGIEGAE